MTRSRWAVAAAAVALTLTSLPASAPAAQRAVPDRIDLPDGWQPEGITTDHKSLYAGSLVDGRIIKANPRTGDTKVLPQSQTGKSAVGVDYDFRRKILWVAGGGSPEVRAQDARTGRVLETYTFSAQGSDNEARFVNDLVVTSRGVFATDSHNQELLVVPFRNRKGKALPNPNVSDTLPLSGDVQFVPGQGEFNLNGIVARGGKRLIAVQSNKGLLFRINPVTGVSREIDLGTKDVTNGDGLELAKGRLYVVQNSDNQIAVVKLRKQATKGRVLRLLTSNDFDTPTTVALVKKSLWAVNARFSVANPTPSTPYWITRVSLR